MFGFLRRHKPLRRGAVGMDMRTSPVDNPLDFREDGSIRPGDPAWDFMEEIMRTGKPGIANQRPDGTWDAKIVEDKDG